VRVGDDELRARRQCRPLEILKIADLHRCRRQIGEHVGARRGHRGDDLGADAGQELAQCDQQIGIGGEADAQEAGHEMGIDHRILQLRALAVDAGRHRWPEISSQRLVKASQASRPSR
jgi:hypothetical protein